MSCHEHNHHFSIGQKWSRTYTNTEGSGTEVLVIRRRNLTLKTHIELTDSVLTW